MKLKIIHKGQLFLYQSQVRLLKYRPQSVLSPIKRFVTLLILYWMGATQLVVAAETDGTTNTLSVKETPKPENEANKNEANINLVSQDKSQQIPSTAVTPIFYASLGAPTSQLRKALETQARVKMGTRSINFYDVSILAKRDLEAILKNANGCAMAIGPEATQRMLAIRQPIQHFSIMTSRNLLDKLYRVYQQLNVSVTGIYEEQPLERQIYLSRATFPDLKEVAIILNQKDKYYLNELQQTARDLGLDLNFRILKASDSPEKYLADITDPDTFLMLTNNEQLYAESKLSALVLAAYYQQIKLIGNRFDHAKTGTLASIYTPTTTLAIEAMSDFSQVCTTQESDKPRFAKSFSVIINQQIAENLNMSELNANQLSKSITQMENK